jgi:hypothetical protein
MKKCNELLFGDNCVAACACEYGTEHSHNDITAEQAITQIQATDISDRPILENGVQYELDVQELKTITGLYFCDECNAFHVSEDNIDEFTKRFN